MKHIHTTTNIHNAKRKFFYAGFLTLALLSVGYVYFVSAAVAHVVVRKELHQEMTKTQTRISDLESAYIIAKDAVGIDAVSSHGFEKNEEKVFVSKVSANAVLSLNNEKR